jgi:predicted RNA-binding Zn ribbon-like protein
MYDFVADRPILNFVATVSERGTTRQEQLRTPADLADWITQSEIVARRPAVTAHDLQRAITLREAAFGLISALIERTAPRGADRSIVNSAAAVPPPMLRLTANHDLARTGGVDAVLSALARDCLDLFGSPDREALHWCADATCTRPFIDRSRGHRRRWCGMQGCGDRAKAAAYRQRRRARAGADQ